MKFRHSIVTRFALFFTALIIFSILVSGYLVFRKASGVIVDYSKENLNHSSELAEQSFYSLLKEVSDDIAVIADSPSLQNYINAPSEETASRNVEKLFRITLQNKADYFQIRWIGIENNGREVIRYEKVDGTISKADTLQKKGDREYFSETLQINPGEFYFSKINLNEEYGVISEPPTPTLRAASPIFNNEGKATGVLVINVDMSRLFNKFHQIARGSTEFYLIDKNGQYLYSPDEKEMFSEQKQTNHNFFSDYDVVFDEENHFKLVKNGDQPYLSYLQEMNYFKERRKIYLITSIKEDILLAKARAVQLYSLRTLLFVCFISILISWVFTSFLSRKINQITKAVSNYESNKNDVNLPVDRKDEIGILANSFVKMKVRIDKNVKELNKALEKEKEAKKQRDEFLQNMSHELRTPLNSILGLIQILHKRSTSEAQSHIIASLERSATNLAGLVYDVLDHQKLIEGKLQIAYKPTKIAQLLKDIHSTYQFEALQKGLTFSLNIDQQLENNDFQTDPLRLSQIVTNLVVNSIKYTKEGEIKLTAKIIDARNPKLEIKLKDTGIGILEENIEKINDRFFREKEETDGRFGGYGLGLSIVKQLTDLFGGNLEATSEKGQGSEFCINIPVERVNTEKKTPSSSEKYLLPEFKNTYNILYIEDDNSTAELIKYILDDKKLIIERADNVENAIKALEDESCNLVISDLMLEDKNMTSNLKKWKTSTKLNTPLILLTALESQEIDEITPFYFQKPYDINYVQDLVYCVLGKNEFEVPDFSNIYSNYDHNPEKVAKVLNLLHEEFKTYLKRIVQVAESGNQKEWESILHKLVANLNNLSLLRLKKIIPEKVSNVTSKDMDLIQQHFAYCLCCFRNESRINLKD